MKLKKPVEHVDIRLVMARYVSYWMSRTSIVGTPFYFRAFIHGEDVTYLLEVKTIFDPLPTTFKRLGGPTGLLMTAASAAVILDGIANNTGVITHAPGPNGLPGGYPVQVKAEGVRVILPDGLTLDDAIRINEEGLRLDGIEKIEDDGTVIFAEKNMAILKETLGYECRTMKLAETEDWAKELHAKYQAFIASH